MNGVYKLVAVKTPAGKKKRDEKLIFKLKTSPGKKTYLGPKQVYRILENNIIKKDVIALEDEKDIPDHSSVPLLRKFLDNRRILCKMPSTKEIQRHHLQQLNMLPPKFNDLDFVAKRFPVIHSEKLKAITQEFKAG